MIPLLGCSPKKSPKEVGVDTADAPLRPPFQCQSTILTPAGMLVANSWLPAPSPELTCWGGYVSSSTTQGSPQPRTAWSSFASRGDQPCDALHAPQSLWNQAEADSGWDPVFAQLLPVSHLASLTPVSSDLPSRNHVPANPISGSASGEADLRHRERLYTWKSFHTVIGIITETLSRCW